MTDLIDVLADDHRRVEAMFAELEADAGDDADGADPGDGGDADSSGGDSSGGADSGGARDSRRRRDVVDVVVAELVRHAVAEELYLCPLIRELLPDGDRLADHEIQRHAETTRTMDALDGTDGAALAPLIAAVRAHVAEQERDLFPRLRLACPPDRLDDLGHRAEAAKRIAPTRPHPNAPHRPPFNKLVTPGTGLVDRVRDALANRPTQPSDL
jgi:hypothetical protein